MLTLSKDEIIDYLGIDYQDERTDRLFERYLSLADKFLQGSLGKNYPSDDERVKEIALIIIGDLYDNHDLNDKTSGTIRRLLNDFQMQLRAEMSILNESEG